MSTARGQSAEEMRPEAKATRGDAIKAHETRAAVKRQQRSRRWRRLGLFVLILVILGAVGRALLPWTVRDYVNRTLDRSPVYAGNIGAVRIHLWRGAYSIEDVRISKRTGNVPVPLFSSERLDFAIQWNALLHRRLVGRMLMEKPEVNFVDAPDKDRTQTGAQGPWLQMLRDLFPFQINQALVRDGSVHFRMYQTTEPVDVYLSQVQMVIDNLGNLRDQTTPLVSTVEVTARAMDQAHLEGKMTLDPFSYRPTFHLATRLLGLEVTRINDLALAYGKFDFKGGWLDFVLEADAKEGQLTGYAKPLFRDLRIFRFTEDTKANPLQLFWQALVGVTAKIFRNQPRDQFGTLIPFSGDLSGATTADILATVGNLLRNAFVRAYLPQLEPGENPDPFLQFGPPEFNDLLSVEESA